MNCLGLSASSLVLKGNWGHGEMTIPDMVPQRGMWGEPLGSPQAEGWVSSPSLQKLHLLRESPHLQSHAASELLGQAGKPSALPLFNVDLLVL